jgi:hypothetical protein
MAASAASGHSEPNEPSGCDQKSIIRPGLFPTRMRLRSSSPGGRQDNCYRFAWHVPHREMPAAFKPVERRGRKCR